MIGGLCWKQRRRIKSGRIRGGKMKLQFVLLKNQLGPAVQSKCRMATHQVDMIMQKPFPVKGIIMYLFEGLKRNFSV